MSSAPDSRSSALGSATEEGDDPTLWDADSPPDDGAEDAARVPGSTVGEYIVLHQLGSGGMGVVYAAYDPKLDRKIALKVLHRDLGGAHDPIPSARMLAEGRALARVNHRNVVTVFDVGSIDDEVYVAMELIEGQTLKQWRSRRPRSWSETVDLFVGVAAGLQAVHEAGLVHRDVKPDNVLIDDRNAEPRVTDFGLARSHVDARPSLEDTERQLIPKSEISRMELTRTGARVGTPAYMSSEQLQGEPATAHSDQFSLCVALWECLYGTRPFPGRSWASLLLAMRSGKLHEGTGTPTGRPVPAWLRRIVARGLALEPGDRWPSVAGLAEALAAGDPNKGRRRVLGGLGLGVIALAMTGAIYAERQAASERARAQCHELGASIHAVWTEPIRREIETRFVATEVGNAEVIAGEVLTTMDEFARAWEQQRSEACIAGLAQTPPPQLDRRIECLEHHRSMFETMVGTFAEPDDVVVTRSQRSTESLADLDSCQDERRLQTMPPLPSDPSVQKEVQRIDALLAGTLVHEHVGRYEEGQQISAAALASALTTEHRPLIAQAHYRVAVFHEKRGEYDAAVSSWLEAFEEATLGGHEQLAAEAAMALAFTEGYQLERHQTGVRWAQLAGLYLERMGMTRTLTEASRIDVLAVLYDMLGDYTTSIATHHQALALRRELAPPGHYSIGYGLVNLAGVLQSSGQFPAAREALIEAKGIFEQTLGPTNPTTAHALNNLAGVEAELGNYDQAEELLTRVQSIWTAHLGAEHPDVGDVHSALGDIRRDQGRLDDAIEQYGVALAIHRKSLAADHPGIARSANRLAQVQWLRGDVEGAERNLMLAMQILREADAGQRDVLGRVRHGLGLIALRRGQAERAAELFSTARADFEGHGDGHPRWVARTRIGSAAARLIAGDVQAASSQLTELMDDSSLDGSVRAEATAWMARVAAKSGDEVAAERARERARAMVIDANGHVRARIEGILDGGTAEPNGGSEREAPANG